MSDCQQLIMEWLLFEVEQAHFRGWSTSFWDLKYCKDLFAVAQMAMIAIRFWPSRTRWEWEPLGSFLSILLDSKSDAGLDFNICTISSAARGGAGSFKRYNKYKSKEHVLIESFVATLIDWTFFLMTWTKLAFVGHVAVRNCMRQQVLDDVKSLPNCGRSQSATTCDSSYAANRAQYNSVLQSTEKYYSVLQSITPALQSTTKYYSNTTTYYSVLQSTTKCYKVLLQ